MLDDAQLQRHCERELLVRVHFLPELAGDLNPVAVPHPRASQGRDHGGLFPVLFHLDPELFAICSANRHAAHVEQLPNLVHGLPGLIDALFHFFGVKRNEWTGQPPLHGVLPGRRCGPEVRIGLVGVGDSLEHAVICLGLVEEYLVAVVQGSVGDSLFQLLADLLYLIRRVIELADVRVLRQVRDDRLQVDQRPLKDLLLLLRFILVLRLLLLHVHGRILHELLDPNAPPMPCEVDLRVGVAEVQTHRVEGPIE